MDRLSIAVVLILFTFSDAAEFDNVCATGQYQSPISIDIDSESIKLVSKSPIQRYLYDMPYTVPLINTGSTVMISFDNLTLVPVIKKESFASAEYLLSQIHFHWEAEHDINGQRFPLEAHFVHYLKEAGNFTNALEINNAVVILTVFYDFSNTLRNRGFDDIVNNMKYISRRPNEHANIKFVPDSLLPSKLDSFFTYEGSLTTPDCNEGIEWIIFETVSYIHSTQYRTLTTIYTDQNQLVKKNNRAMQCLNKRDVEYSAGSERWSQY